MRKYVLFVAAAATLIVIAPRLSSAMPLVAASATGTAISAAPNVEKIQYGPYGYYGPSGYYGYGYYQPYSYGYYQPYSYGYYQPYSYGYYRPYGYYHRPPYRYYRHW